MDSVLFQIKPSVCNAWLCYKIINAIVFNLPHDEKIRCRALWTKYCFIILALWLVLMIYAIYAINLSMIWGTIFPHQIWYQIELSTGHKEDEDDQDGISYEIKV